MSEKLLEIEDLLGDDEDVLDESTEELYDLVIPPGVPASLIHEIVAEFELEPHNKVVNSSVEDGEYFGMKLIVLRGDRETVERANKYLFDVFDDRVGCFED